MFDRQCLRDDAPRPTRSQQSGQGRQEMQEESQKVTHGPRSYRYRLGSQVYEIRAIRRHNRNSPGTGRVRGSSHQLVVSRPWYRAAMAVNPRELRGKYAGPSKTRETRRRNGGGGSLERTRLHSNSLLNREKTGNFCDSRRYDRIFDRINSSNQ